MREGEVMSCPCGDGHPALSRPVSLDVLAEELRSVLARATDPRLVAASDGLRVTIADPGSPLSRTHARNPRRYAQCVPAEGTFEFAPQVLWLPRGNRIGLIAHELGHWAAHVLGDPGHSEADADRAALEEFGVEIRYDRRWPGKGLQAGRFVQSARRANPRGSWRLLEVRRSRVAGKKWQATFRNEATGRERTTHFGAVGYEDFTTHRDPERKARYLERHGRGREDWSDPTSAGALSRWILWNKPTVEASVADFRRRFGL